MISFINSGFLFFLAAGILPILVYFFAKKKPIKVVFSSIKFIKISQQDQRKKIKFQQIILLILRILTILAIVLGIARPALRISFLKGNSHPQTAIAVICDNSYSMDYLVDTSSDLSIAKVKILELNQLLQNEDKIILMSRDKNWNEKNDEIISGNISKGLLQDIKITPKSEPWDLLIKEAQKRLDETEIINTEIYLFTDRQFEEIKSEIPVFVISTNDLEEKKNVFCRKSFYQKNLVENTIRNEVVFELENTDSKDINIVCNLVLDEQTLSKKVLRIPANQIVREKFYLANLLEGWHEGYVQINNERLPFDDRNYFTFFYQQYPKIGIFNPGKIESKPITAIAKLFTQKDDNIFVVENGSQIPNTKIDAWIVLGNEEFSADQKFVVETLLKSDIPVVFFANNQKNDWYFNELEEEFSIRINDFNSDKIEMNFSQSYDEFISEMKKIEDFTIRDFWNVENRGKSIINWQKKTLLMQNSKQKYFFAFSANSETNPFWINPSFAVIMYRILHPNQVQNNLEFEIGKKFVVQGNKIELPNNKSIELKSSFFIPANTGIYQVFSNQEEKQRIAVNLNYSESKYSIFAQYPENWKVTTEKWKEEIFENKFGTEFWKIMFFLALVFLIIEMSYVRYLQKKFE